MTDIEKFEAIHIVHDYMLFDENGDIIASIASTEKGLYDIVYGVIKGYNGRRAQYYNLSPIEKVIAHQTYTNKEYIFYI